MSEWDARAAAYRESPGHRAGRDLELLVEACGASEGVKALDVASGGGHVARRLREAGAEVVTVDASPGMEPDVVAPAEALPFDDASFDLVVTRIAPHHFADVRAAVAEMARVSRDLVVVEDTLYLTEDVEEAERVRDPTHVRSYRESEWRDFLVAAGLELEAVEYVEKEHDFAEWLARTSCEGKDAERARELLADRTLDDRDAWTDVKILLKARKRAA
jgi:ubiquinone/menaquinone biosynthesis C-methylase UbiE